jgi:glucokinase
MRYKNDNRIVMTLDAGGTNFVFSAMQGNKEIISPITLPSHAHDLNACLTAIKEGFSQVVNTMTEEPVAISFAFPGPADYPNGIIGDLGNLPAFRGGVALGPMLQNQFGKPVFINNDGDLFAYGESIAGFLPFINDKLKKAGSPKYYKNLLGITLGTGFGGGIVSNGELFLGDNSAAAEIWLLRNGRDTKCFAEEGASIRAVKRTYARLTGGQAPEPKEIYEIAIGALAGNQQAARDAFQEMARVVGDALANAITLVDGLVVIGGGLTGAHPVFLNAVVEEMNTALETVDGKNVNRMESKAFNLEDSNEFEKFIRGNVSEIVVPGSQEKMLYDSMKRVGVGITRLGTSRATAVGAYAFALNSLDRRRE